MVFVDNRTGKQVLGVRAGADGQGTQVPGQADGTWSYRRAAGLDAGIVIPSIECTLSLAEVYDRVAFAAE